MTGDAAVAVARARRRELLLLLAVRRAEREGRPADRPTSPAPRRGA